jgi:hypothetical protein
MSPSPQVQLPQTRRQWPRYVSCQVEREVKTATTMEFERKTLSLFDSPLRLHTNCQLKFFNQAAIKDFCSVKNYLRALK